MKFSLLILTVFLSKSILAQDGMEIGLLVGTTLSKAQVESNEIAHGFLTTNAKMGIRANFKLSKNVGIETGIEFVFRPYGFQFNETEDTPGSRINLAIEDFEIPILLARRIDLGSSLIFKPLIGIAYCFLEVTQGGTRIGGPSYYYEITKSISGEDYFSARIAAQFLKTLSKKSKLGVNFEFNYHPNPIVQGKLIIVDSNGMRETDYSYSGSYFSLGIFYLFKI